MGVREIAGFAWVVLLLVGVSHAEEAEREGPKLAEIFEGVSSDDPQTREMALLFYYGMLYRESEEQRRDALDFAPTLEPLLQDPKQPGEFQAQLATTYRNLGDDAGHREVLERMAAENPTFETEAGYSAEYGRALEFISGPNMNHARAIEILEPLLPYSSGISPAQQSRIGRQLTNLYVNQGDYDKAIALGELTRAQLAEDSPDDRLNLLNDIAYSYFQTENYELAAMVYDELLERAKAITPDSAGSLMQQSVWISSASQKAHEARLLAESRRTHVDTPETLAANNVKQEQTTPTGQTAAALRTVSLAQTKPVQPVSLPRSEIIDARKPTDASGYDKLLLGGFLMLIAGSLAFAGARRARRKTLS